MILKTHSEPVKATAEGADGGGMKRIASTILTVALAIGGVMSAKAVSKASASTTPPAVTR